MKPEIDLDQANETLVSLTAEQRLRWIVERLGDKVAQLSSLQKTASVLMHLFYQLGLSNEILFVDTGFHFHETLRLRDLYMNRYRLNLVTIYPVQTPEQQETQFGRKLHMFVDGQPQCCRLRKEEPFLNYVREHGKRAIVKGLRKEEGGRRGNARIMGWDPRTQTYDFHPIFDWTEAQVLEYLTQHDVPIHPLHAQSYPSIGCACCTTPVGPGEDARAGRWRHLRAPEETGPQYCGINFTDGSGI